LKGARFIIRRPISVTYANSTHRPVAWM